MVIDVYDNRARLKGSYIVLDQGVVATPAERFNLESREFATAQEATTWLVSL